jgi:SAM-dependent methyltransferase
MKRQFAKQYANLEEWHWWFRGRQRILESVLRREFGPKDSISIASVGCGPAEGLQWLEQFTGLRGKIVGIDVEPMHARRIAPRIEYVIGSLETAPFADHSFDAVLALDVLEHLDNDSIGLYMILPKIRVLRTFGEAGLYVGRTKIWIDATSQYRER